MASSSSSPSSSFLVSLRQLTTSLPSHLPFTLHLLSREHSLLTLKIISVFGSGIITGGIFSLSYFTVPALLLIPSTYAQKQWSHMYQRGKLSMPPLALLTSSIYTYLSYTAYHHYPLRPSSSTSSLLPTFLQNLLPRPFRSPSSKPTLYALAALLTLSIVPYTILVMRRTIDGLEAAGAQIARCKSSSSAEKVVVSTAIIGGKRGKSTKELIDDWGVLNLGRAVLTGLGGLLAGWGALGGVEGL